LEGVCNPVRQKEDDVPEVILRGAERPCGHELLRKERVLFPNLKE